jgi:23S rRNA pseudouridine1911/1915/1917 synthase
MEICRPTDPGGQRAELGLLPVRCLPPFQLVEIRPLTGRKHQIRIQLAARGAAIVGDVKYGSRLPFGPGIALHARSISFRHPVRSERIELLAPWPDSWRDRFGELLRDNSGGAQQ